jgi:imidazoleglycerol phosphate synthase glutamine amidotransferase subunit HisH
MGWNRLNIIRRALTAGLSAEPYFYFVTRTMSCRPTEEIVAATCDYHRPFVALVGDQLFAASSIRKRASDGLQLLRSTQRQALGVRQQNSRKTA